MPSFEKVSRFADLDIALPVRKTANSAGYDMMVAEDTIIQPYITHYNILNSIVDLRLKNKVSLEELEKYTKKTGSRPSLVSTGVKCHLEEGTYLELSVRSSSPLKYWLILANGVGIIDADYYNNPSNEGEIFFQLINLSPYPLLLKKGDIIGQGIIKQYLKTDDDIATGERIGGFGSTNG